MLNRKEEEVWRMTPRTFAALLKVHFDLKKAGAPSSSKDNEFIDNIPGW